MILVDYHMHSSYSHDGVGRLEEHVRRAEAIGLAEVCFTEHLDFYPSSQGTTCSTLLSEAELERYLEEVQEIGPRSRIRVRAGVELDYKPEADRCLREFLQRHSFDFLLGSVHNVEGGGVSDREGAISYFEQRGALQGCIDYLAIVEQAVGTGLFDSFAHLDLIKRFRPSNGELMRNGQLRERMVALFDRMAATGTGIEINTAGLVHDPQEAYPALDLLKLARDRGVTTLTIGSDSHRPETVGRYLDAALDLARAAGYTHIHTFERRVPVAHPI